MVRAVFSCFSPIHNEPLPHDHWGSSQTACPVLRKQSQQACLVTGLGDLVASWEVPQNGKKAWLLYFKKKKMQGHV